MKQKRNVVLIPGTEPFKLKPQPKPRDKKIVIGYSLVDRDNDNPPQIRQDILSLIKGHHDWELSDVLIDYRLSESQYWIQDNYIKILQALKNYELDVLIIHSGGVLKNAIAAAGLICWGFRKIKCYIINENTIRPAKHYLRG